MATESPNSRNPVPAILTPAPPLNGNVVDEHDATHTEVAKSNTTSDATEISFLPHSEPVRQEQVQNAVNFLSHPKVRGSPIIYRRSFLEKKGLSKKEIDEAFHLVPDPPTSNVPYVEVPTTNQASIQSSSLQPQPPIQSLQLADASVGSVAMVPSVHESRFRLSQMLINVGLVCASGYGSTLLFKNLCVPRLKSWIRKAVAEENVSGKEDKPHSGLFEQTTEAAKAAAMAATVVAKASEELLNSKNEEKKYFEAFMNKIDAQVKEMKSVGEAIHELEGTKGNGEYKDKLMEDNIRSNNGNTNIPLKSYQQSQTNGTSNPDYTAVRPSSSPATVEPTTAPHPKSYMEIIAMIQRGERPSNIREINDMPPNPNQQPSKSSLAPRPKPWELSRPNNEDGSEPWWKKKTVDNVEINSDSSNISGLASNQRAWVPPQPPAVAIPEASAAIRHPKKFPLTHDSSNGDVPDTENNIESNGSKSKEEISTGSIVEDISEKDDEIDVRTVGGGSSTSSFREQHGKMEDDGAQIS